MSVLSIYPRILMSVFIVYRRIVRILCMLLYMLMCVSCFGLVVSTCQVIGWKDPSEDTLTWWGDYLHKAQVKESVWVYFSFVWFVYVPMCSPPSPGPTQYIFHTPMTQYSLFVLKASLNSNQPTNLMDVLTTVFLTAVLNRNHWKLFRERHHVHVNQYFASIVQ